MNFHALYDQGFVRVAACTVPVELADPATNAQRILDQVRACHDEGVAVALFPELSVSGYSIEDLLLQDVLLDEVDEAIRTIAEASADLLPVIVVGAPIAHGDRLYNCGVAIHGGEVIAVAPKAYLPTYREFYEKRWFAQGDDAAGQFLHRPHWPGADPDGDIPFGPDVLIEVADVPGLTIHIEVCEDMWVPVPPSARAALAGATVLLNLSASPMTIGRDADRHLLARSASARCTAAYLYAAAMAGESTTDLSWDGMAMVYEMGDLLGQTDRFPETAGRIVVDVDLDRIRQERMRSGSHDDNRRTQSAAGGAYRIVSVTLDPPREDLGLRRHVDRFPLSQTIPRDWRSTATRGTTSRCTASSSGCVPSPARPPVRRSMSSALRRSSSASRAASTPHMRSSSPRRPAIGSGCRARTSSPSRCRGSRRPRILRATRSGCLRRSG